MTAAGGNRFGDVMVLGGGISGIQAALDFAAASAAGDAARAADLKVRLRSEAATEKAERAVVKTAIGKALRQLKLSR